MSEKNELNKHLLSEEQIEIKPNTSQLSIQLAEQSLDLEAIKNKDEKKNKEIVENDIKETPNNDLISTELRNYHDFLSKFGQSNYQNKMFPDYVKEIYEEARNFIQKPIRIMNPSPNLQKKNEIKSIALSPDQTKLLTGGVGKILYIFDISNEGISPEKYFLDRTIESVGYSLKGDKILAGTNDGLIFIKNLITKQEIRKKLNTKQKRVMTAAFSADGESIIFGADDGFLRICHLKQVNDEYTEIINHDDGVCAFVFSPAVKRYATGGNDKIINIFNLNEKEGRAENIIKITKHKGIIRALAFSNDGKIFIVWEL